MRVKEKDMSEYINNVTRRKEILRDVLIQLHQGKPVHEVKKLFAALTKEATADEIAQVEQLMIEEGLPVEEIQRLCDVHVAVFRDGLDEQQAPETIPGHPIHTFTAENEVVMRFLDQMLGTIHSYRSTGDPKHFATFRFQLEKLGEFDRHYLRKEMLLFPFLECYGFYGPSKVMWGIHDEIRADIRGLEQWLGEAAEIDPDELETRFQVVAGKIRDMVYKEEKILFPASLEHLTEGEWNRIHDQEDEIGFFLVVPGRQWAEKRIPIELIHTPASPPAATEKPVSTAELPLNTGGLSLEQIDLMLRHLPVDITFVDEHDTVRYFSQTDERIFTRTPAIIGRKVQNCHPPQSVGRVQQILDSFRAGTRDSAEFWINFAGRMIHIRYFALRDERGVYRGTLEVTQDITSIRELQGERRLLDDK